MAAVSVTPQKNKSSFNRFKVSECDFTQNIKGQAGYKVSSYSFAHYLLCYGSTAHDLCVIESNGLPR
jgi:hypothetical protein